jgi:hypothetical protein
MIEELATVALTEDVPEHNLRTGDVGTVVHVYPSGEACEVEFMTIGGMTLNVVRLEVRQIRLVDAGEMMQARPLGAA